MVHELTQDNWKEFIKDGKVIIDVWRPSCSWCDKYEPVFEAASKEHPSIKFGKILIQDEPSEFKRTYMKARPGEALMSPMTLVFKDGALVGQGSGYLEAPQLKQLIETGKVDKPEPVRINLKQMSLVELKAAVYDFEKEISRR